MSLRSKRTRTCATTASSRFGVDVGGEHASSSSGANTADGDFLMHMDPSLMTERQQLAFLLRKTAQNNADDDESSSSSESAGSSTESSDGGTLPRHRRAPKKARRSAEVASASTSTSSPLAPTQPLQSASTREEMIAAALKNPRGLVLYCGRGRPPKNAIKFAPGEQMPEDLKRLVEKSTAPSNRNTSTSTTTGSSNTSTASTTVEVVKNELRVKTVAKGKADAAMMAVLEATKPREKTSPSSTNDISHMHIFEDVRSGFWDPQCALCCHPNNSRFGDAPLLDALFLCPTCDQKYPTQRTLGLV